MYTKTQKPLKFDITFADLAFGNYYKFCIRKISEMLYRAIRTRGLR